MAEKTTTSKRYLILVLTVSMVLLLLCCGEFIRIEITLKEQYSKIQHLETVVSSRRTIKSPKTSKPFHAWVKKALQDTKMYRTRRSISVEIDKKDSITLGNNEKKLVKLIRNEFNEALLKFFERKYLILVPGPPGPPGKAGLIGPQGKPGSKGQKGSRGETGVQGLVGHPGIHGQKGMRGPPGLKGEVGSIGLQGPRGMPGSKGEPGQSLVAPTIVVSPQNLAVNESQAASFHCFATGFPRPDVSWSKVGGSLPHKRTTQINGELKIQHVKMSDIGQYKCMASNILGKEEQFIRLEVNSRPKIALDKGPMYVAIGTNITLPKCHSNGFPKPKVTWSKSSGQLKSNHRTTSRGDLSLIEVNESDSGKYVCKAQNSFGTAVAGFELVVVGLPVFVDKPDTSYYVSQGTDLKIKCSARGNPKPVITWRKKKGFIDSKRHELKVNSLVLKNIQNSDSGTYICVAISAGVSKVKVKTKVQLFYQDCSDLFKSGVRENGVYTVSPDNKSIFQVYCDMTTDGGGWTVFQRRQDGSVDFYRNWQKYKAGFGNLSGEFWLGNKYIHQLTAKSRATLRVELEDWEGIKVYAKYGSFAVADESDQYRLQVSTYSGSAGDSLSQHNGMSFTSKDRDNDLDKDKNLAVEYNGAWWYYDDYSSNLNGKYSRNSGNWQGINWVNFKWGQTLKYTEMKVRPQNF